jgi:hypothetical protein
MSNTWPFLLLFIQDKTIDFLLKDHHLKVEKTCCKCATEWNEETENKVVSFVKYLEEKSLAANDKEQTSHSSSNCVRNRHHQKDGKAGDPAFHTSPLA